MKLTRSISMLALSCVLSGSAYAQVLSSAVECSISAQFCSYACSNGQPVCYNIGTTNICNYGVEVANPPPPHIVNGPWGPQCVTGYITATNGFKYGFIPQCDSSNNIYCQAYNMSTQTALPGNDTANETAVPAPVLNTPMCANAATPVCFYSKTTRKGRVEQVRVENGSQALCSSNNSAPHAYCNSANNSKVETKCNHGAVSCTTKQFSN